MTTIAWDGKTLAGDRLAVWAGLEMRCRKVYRVVAPNRRVALVGYTGSVAFVNAHLHWLYSGERPTFSGPDLKWSVLMLAEGGGMWIRHDNVDYWDQITGRRTFAVGSGADFALAAMELGKDAVAAVRVAAKLDHGTGGGVDVVRFR